MRCEAKSDIFVAKRFKSPGVPTHARMCFRLVDVRSIDRHVSAMAISGTSPAMLGLGIRQQRRVGGQCPSYGRSYG